MQQQTGKSSSCERKFVKVNDSRDRVAADCARELNLEVVC